MLKQMLIAAINLDGIVIVTCDGEQDYKGRNIVDAMEAIEAVDEAEVTVLVEGERGWALICNDLNEEERIADCSGWCDRWLDAN